MLTSLGTHSQRDHSVPHGLFGLLWMQKVKVLNILSQPTNNVELTQVYSSPHTIVRFVITGQMFLVSEATPQKRLCSWKTNQTGQFDTIYIHVWFQDFFTAQIFQNLVLRIISKCMYIVQPMEATAHTYNKSLEDACSKDEQYRPYPIAIQYWKAGIVLVLLFLIN